MVDNTKTTQKAARRFSLSWQLSLGMASGFFIVFVLFALVVTAHIKQYYGILPARLYHWLWGTVFLGGLATFVFAFLLTRFILRPVKSIETTIEALRDDPMTDVRAQKTGPNDEFSDLISVLNRMIGRLQNLIVAQQQFVSDVSHELRTPVTIVKGHMDLLNRWGKDEPEVLDDSIKSSLAEMQRMETLINEMLNLTRAEQIPIENVQEITEIGGLTHRVFDNFKLIHPEFIFTFDDDLTQVANVKVRQDHMEQILIILADNAVKYSSDRKEKFSIHYRIEKWFFEDGKEDTKKALLLLGEGLTLVAMLSMLFLFPALFH